MKYCDEIVVIGKGKVVPNGTHEELVKEPVSMSDGQVVAGHYSNQWSTLRYGCELPLA